MFADLQADDCTKAAAAAGRLRQSLHSCSSVTSEAVFAAALSANVMPTLVRLLSSSSVSVGDDCAACLGYFAACAIRRRDAASGNAALT